jgi:hypothetical protein
MSTSIRDLLMTADAELSHAASGRGSDTARDARAAIQTAGRILNQLRIDGLDEEVGGPRENLTAQLARDCCAVQDLGHSGTNRAAPLLGAAGDAIAALRNEATRSERWALTISIATTTRRATEAYIRYGPYLPDPEIATVRQGAIAVARLGAEQPPNPSALIVQDRPIPSVEHPHPLTPMASALQAAHLLSAETHRSATGLQPPLALYEMKAVAMTAEAAARYAEALDAAHRGDAGISRADAPTTWQRTRQALAVFIDGRLPETGGDEQILRHAAQLHEGLRRRFGPPDYLPAGQLIQLNSADGKAILGIVNQLPQLADDLRRNLSQLHGRLIASADRLPLQENRVAERLLRSTVVVGGGDFNDLTRSLHRAQGRSVELAMRLSRQENLGTGTAGHHLAAHSLGTDVRAVTPNDSGERRHAPQIQAPQQRAPVATRGLAR